MLSAAPMDVIRLIIFGVIVFVMTFSWLTTNDARLLRIKPLSSTTATTWLYILSFPVRV
jgi:hypothetical protein